MCLLLVYLAYPEVSISQNRTQSALFNYATSAYWLVATQGTLYLADSIKSHAVGWPLSSGLTSQLVMLCVHILEGSIACRPSVETWNTMWSSNLRSRHAGDIVIGPIITDVYPGNHQRGCYFKLWLFLGEGLQVSTFSEKRSSACTFLDLSALTMRSHAHFREIVHTTSTGGWVTRDNRYKLTSNPDFNMHIQLIRCQESRIIDIMRYISQFAPRECANFHPNTHPSQPSQGSGLVISLVIT